MSDEVKDMIAVLTAAHDQTQAQIDSMRKKFVIGWILRKQLDKAQKTLNEGRATELWMKRMIKVFNL